MKHILSSSRYLITGGGFFLLVLFLIVSCQPDLVEEDPVLEGQHKMSITHTSLSRLSKSAPEVYDRSLSLALSDSKFNKSSGDSTSLVLDTTNVYITEGLDYKNYIFRVEPDADSQPEKFQNLMIVRLRDSLTHQYLVTYKMLDAVTIDTTDVKIEGFFAEDLSGHMPMKCGGTDVQMTWVPGHYVEVNCSAGGDHTPYEQCNGKEGERAYVYWVAGYYDIQFIPQTPCLGEDPDQGSSNGGGGGSRNDNDGDDDDTIEVGMVFHIDPPEEDPECKYLNKLVNDVTFMQRLDGLIFSVNNEGYERIHEYAEDLNGNELPFYADQGTQIAPSAPVRTLANNTLRRIMIHTHFEKNLKITLQSMFSYGDIQVFLNDVLKVNAHHTADDRIVDTSEMTSILVASDDESNYVYAIKKNPNSPIANHYRGHQINSGMTLEEISNEEVQYKSRIERAKNQRELELIALKQLEKMGLHLYRAHNNQTEWKRLTLDLDPSNPDKPKLGESIPCD